MKITERLKAEHGVFLYQLDRLEGNAVPDHLLANQPADRILPPELPSRMWLDSRSALRLAGMTHAEIGLA